MKTQWNDVFFACTLAAASALAASAAGETYVIPVVVSGVPGLNGSYWDSEVRVVKLSYASTVTVRRNWVALPGGGLADDPGTAPTWTLGPNNLVMVVLTGADLLTGMGATSGAVALEIDGGADVFLHVTDTKGAARLRDASGVACCLPGSGQVMRILPQPLLGASRAGFATAGSGMFRINVGLVNPNSVPIDVRVRLMPFDSAYGVPPFVWQSPWAGLPNVVVTVPPLGWVQLNSPYERLMCSGTVNPFCASPESPLARPPGPVALEFLPTSDRAYHAYVSLIYSPTNDPEFVPVVPGGFDLPSN